MRFTGFAPTFRAWLQAQLNHGASRVKEHLSLPVACFTATVIPLWNTEHKPPSCRCTIKRPELTSLLRTSRQPRRCFSRHSNLFVMVGPRVTWKFRLHGDFQGGYDQSRKLFMDKLLGWQLLCNNDRFHEWLSCETFGNLFRVLKNYAYQYIMLA